MTNNSQKDKWSIQYLRLLARRLGINAKTLIDVGVGYGTPELYEAFKSTRIILIEPLLVYRNTILEIQDKYDATWINSAAGSKNGNVEIIIDNQYPERSSIHIKDLASGSIDIKKHIVPIRTIDSIIIENKLEGPYIIKIDTEGHELEVIEGAMKCLSDCDMLIAEVSVATRYRNGYRFSEMIAKMANEGFELMDILTFSNTPPIFIDAVFTKTPWRKLPS